MSGHNVFEQIVAFADIKGDPRPLITEAEFEAWKKLYTFEGLRGLRYGQSFCKHFGITDNLLFFSLTPTDVDTYIRKKYIERSRISTSS